MKYSKKNQIKKHLKKIKNRDFNIKKHKQILKQSSKKSCNSRTQKRNRIKPTKETRTKQ